MSKVVGFMLKNDTIAAIATPPGEGGIAVVRVSGPKAVEISDRIFSGSIASYASHTVHLGVVQYEGVGIDQALVLVMRAPRSFTGEDVVEFQCHGGYFACSQILEALVKEGARSALPGEFSQRAFLNGKIDLIQAEAIQNLIVAENIDAFRIAQNHFQGHFSRKVQQITSLIVEALAFIEVVADFPEEDVAGLTQPYRQLEEADAIIVDLLASFGEGQRLAQGTRLVLAGHPNAGKSSLLNALTNKNRAIVTNIPGTTRDILEETWVFHGKCIRLVDSAGLRETDDLIEQEGVQRAKEAMESAEGILWVVDATQPDPVLPEILFSKPSLLIWNKSDVAQPPKLDCSLQQVVISAKTGEGLAALKEILREWLLKAEESRTSKVFLVSARHHSLLQEMHQCIQRALQGMNEALPPECVALDLRQALHATGNLSGSEVTETVLGEIFSRFCIGK